MLEYVFDRFIAILNTLKVYELFRFDYYYHLLCFFNIYINVISIINMDRKKVLILLGVCELAALMYGLYHMGFFWSKRQKNIDEQSSIQMKQMMQSQNDDAEQPKEHIPYKQLKYDYQRYSLGDGTITFLPHLKAISYNIILSLQKGHSYQGIVNISLHLDSSLQPDTEIDYFSLDFNGEGIKYVMVNGVQIPQHEVLYQTHKIKIKRSLLTDKHTNNIEIIFQNGYSFLNNGLASYLPVDENNKYSLKQQLIYAINGYLNVKNIIPCINCLNECSVQLEVIHPDNFEVVSNATKSLGRLSSILEYPKYGFLSDMAGASLNRILGMQNTYSPCKGSTINFDTISTFTSNFTNYRQKYNTHFTKQKLPSIHHFFIFSSSVIELHPKKTTNQVQQQLMLRYFCKQLDYQQVNKNISKLHGYIIDVVRRLSSEDIKIYLNKIDILIINDKEVEGYFAPGVIMLSADTLTKHIDIQCFYLVARALMGLLRLAVGKNMVTLEQILILNVDVFRTFSQFCNFIFLKNQHYSKLQTFLKSNQGDFINKNEGFILSYYSKQLKYMIKKNVFQQIQFQLKNLMISYHKDPIKQYWQNFMSQQAFLSPLIIQQLLHLSINHKKLPQNDTNLLHKLKTSFASSKYALHFYTNREISDDLARFMQAEVHGLEIRLTGIKVKEKFRDFITQRYVKYLPIKSNIVEAETIYNQFKKFQQSKNFHHLSLLKTQIARVSCFGKDFVKNERIDIKCGLSCWKLLIRIKMYPHREEFYHLVKLFEGFQQ